MPHKSPSYLLDTSALIAYLADEKGANQVAKLRKQCVVPFMALSEMYYIITRRLGRDEADRIFGLVKSWGLPVLLPDERVIINAGRLKAAYALGIADSYIAALAGNRQAVLVTKDPDFKRLKGEVEILFIA